MICVNCDEEIPADDARGVAQGMHSDCLIRLTVGSVGHQMGLCSCNGGPGTLDDPPGLTRRQAAQRAAAMFRESAEQTQIAEELAPGVYGTAEIGDDGILYILSLFTRKGGADAVRGYLDSLPTDRTIVLPPALFARPPLADMLRERGFAERTIPGSRGEIKVCVREAAKDHLS